MKYFKYKKDKLGIGTLIFDTPRSSANVFSIESMSELDEMLNTLAQDAEIKALFIQSAKKDIFIAGADINEIKTANNEQQINSFVKQGQDLFNKLENLPFPTVAIIDGACLGGGLEMALACTYRIATSDEHTRLGLPEVNLGLIPGFGGTQRLYPLLGYAKAMELILGAKQLRGEKALKLGLVDACVPSGYLDFKKEEYIKQIVEDNFDAKIKANRKGIKWYEYISFTRNIIDAIAKKKVMQKTAGHYPAPLMVIDVMQNSFLKPLEEGLDIEREAEVQLALTPVCKNLIELFLISEELKHDSFSKSKPKEVKYSAVVGTGVMGSGIAWAMNHQNIEVRLKVRSYESAANTIQNIRKIYDSIMKRNRITTREIDLKMDRVTFTKEYSGFENMDFLLEAVSEDETLKEKIYAEFEEVVASECIMASNTSSISISNLAKRLKYPNRFVGMHFFNPVDRMPLVEIIAGEKTDDKTLATVVHLAKQLGKTPIKIKDSAGFLVNRILLPYLQEAVMMFEEGQDLQDIDEALLDFGMPMGPFTLIDTVGVDVGANVSVILHNAYGDRIKPSSLMNEMVEKGYLGKKTKKGFYDYSSKEAFVNQDISTFKKANSTMNQDAIVNRAILIMINEASRCLEENVVDNARYLDMAMVMGTGFPAFRGGLMRYADEIGIPQILKQLNELQTVDGDRFTPSQLLVNMEKENISFYGDVL
ncbi:fatty acid oxidation complex subunit alpha [Sulfurimonas gotlandica GD1]|uniref:enoyl-CoA hydratase n=1 Tax=Sulfurimonas gotlandica (strain DSM 19862 / JCM 16533 / GD1) TaxID=929558 RepID=B6BLQ4_SULGG|nr:3-hydroxyacyl-CoA dehydrogenase NAD-binding domain-containing protein [Sulfurimonas gotlandica]EDZ62086.1 fatty acid oxidation complex alpha subunit [Sulfurimonas gotlandica GD1]EHP28714.1 fatty acid oxidation complex subunit alpha [Sulfurimonas gotlandica GD1]